MPFIPGEEKLTPAFRQKVTDIAGRLGAAPEDLLGVMSFETGGQFSPSLKNRAGSGATGLIQFLPSTAQGLGTTPQALAAMSPEQQLDVVEKYLTPFKGKLTSLKDTYMAVLYPQALGAPESTPLFQKGGQAYAQNAGLDVRGRGQITVGDVLSRVRRFLGGGTAEASTRSLDEEIDREIGLVRQRQQDDLAQQYIKEKNRQIDNEFATALKQIKPGASLTEAPPPETFGERIGRDVLQVGGGIRDAFVNTMQSLNLVGDWMREHGIGPSGKLTVTIPEVQKAGTVEGDIIRGASQFLTDFLPATRAVKAIGLTGALASGEAAGAIANFLAFDPRQPRISNLIQQLPAAVQNPVTDFLAAKPNDTEAEGRFKNALEGLGLGLLTNGIFGAVKLMRGASQLQSEVGQTAADTLTAGANAAPGAAGRRVAGAPGGAVRMTTDEEVAQAMAAKRPTATPAAPPAPATEPPLTAPRPPPRADAVLPPTEPLPRAPGEPPPPVPPSPAVPTPVAPELPPLPGAAALQSTPTAVRISESTATQLEHAETLPPSLSIGPRQREQAQQFQAAQASGASGAVPTEGHYLHINFDRIQTGDDLKQTIGTVAEIMNTETEAQRRGVQSTAQTLAGAERSPFQEVDRILDIGPGSALAAEDATAVRQVWLASAERLQALSQELAQGNLAVSDEWLRQFVLTANVHTKAMGTQAEAGRALRAFGIDMPSTDKQFLHELADAMQGATTPESQALLQSVGAAGASQHAMNLAQSIAGLTSPQEYASAALLLQQTYSPQQLARLSQQQHMAAMLAALTSPEQLATFMRDAERVPAADMFTELWYGALLSSPPTHVVNTLDGALRTLWAIPERYFATVMGNPSEMARNFQAANSYVYGLKQGLQEAWRYAADAFQTGVSRFGSAKLDFPRQPAITAAGAGLEEGSMLGGVVDLLGSVARFSGRGMMATDEFFKTLNYRMQLHESAFRQATEEGLTGSPLAQRIAALTDNPTPALRERASAWAQYQTLSQPLTQEGGAFESLGNFVDHIAQGRNDWLPAKIVLPFIKTPFNIVRYGLERVPILGNLSANVNRRLLAGGADGALARSQMALGGMTMALFGLLASEGHEGGEGPTITGKAPIDPGQRQTWERLGIQPYSIWVPGLQKYVSYNRLDLIGLPLGLAADFVSIARESPTQNFEQITGALLGAVFNSVTSKTWLKGVADVIDAVTPGRGDADKKSGTDFERYLRQLVGSTIPSGVGLVARMIDPVQRETRTMVDALLERIPGLSSTLPPRLDIWGRPRLRPEPVGPDLLSPFMSRDYAPDAVDNELYRLQVPLDMPKRDIVIPRAGQREADAVTLTPQQYNRYVELSAGKGLTRQVPLKEALQDLMRTPAYEQLSDGPNGGKSFLIRDVVNAYREIGLAQLRTDDPSVEKLLERKAISRALMQTREGQERLKTMDFSVGAPVR